MLNFIPFCIKLLDTEDKSGCRKPSTRGYILYLCIYLVICASICLFETESEYKSRPKFHRQSLFRSKGGVWLAVFPTRIKWSAAISSRKIQMNSQKRVVAPLCYGRSARSHSVWEQASVLMLAIKAQSHLASDVGYCALISR